jgi:hypothetical protein
MGIIPRLESDYMTPNNPISAYFQPPDPTDGVGLSANRAGELTPEQKKTVQGRLWPRLIGAIVLSVIFMPMVVCFGGGIASTLMVDGEGVFVGWMLGFFLLIFLVAVGSSLLAAWRPLLGLLDLLGGRVEATEGRLVWRGRDYRGVTEGRTLSLLPGAEVMPGGYRFYFLPRSGYIVSMERSFLGGSDLDPLAEVRRALQSVFDFVDDDLPDNRSGRLSQRQVNAHLWSNVRTGLFLLPFLLLALAFAIGFPAAFIGAPLIQGEGVGDGWLPGLIGLLFGGGFALGLGWASLSPFLDVIRGEVTAIEGEVVERAITTGAGKSRRTNYYYIVNGQRFNVGQRGHTALVQGGRYRLYFFPRSKGMVAVEPLSM